MRSTSTLPTLLLIESYNITLLIQYDSTAINSSSAPQPLTLSTATLYNDAVIERFSLHKCVS